ncbi:MAG: hypothetical protein K2P61_04645 [Burkholderiaceae bacterium]|nr:hypothetical protein [Burkholderiaceae bacterium]
MIRFALLLFAATMQPVFAQTSFMGIPLDSPFPGEITECPKMVGFHMVDRNRLKEVGTCYFMENVDKPNNFTISNGPDLGIGHVLTIETYEEMPIFFKFSFNKAKYDQAVDIFVTRYGKPQKVYRETVRTRAGAAFDSRTNIWDSAKLRIQLDEIGKNVQWADATIINVPVFNSMTKKKKEDAKAAAEKL